MSEITFVYMNNKYNQIIKNKEILIAKELINYANILNKNINQLYFIHNGRYLSINNKKRIKDFHKKNIIIFVFKLDNNNSKNKENRKLTSIICPECEDIAIVNSNDSKVSIENCVNNHKITNLSIDNFLYLQNYNYSEIKCLECLNKSIYYDNFYICSCKNYICPICIKKHKNKNKDHTLIDYQKRFNNCQEHNNEFKLYCQNCNINLCFSCQEERHNNHKILNLKEIKPNENNINEIYIQINNSKDKINEFINYYNL